MTDLLTHACRWDNCADCPEPRRCDCTCHVVAETPPLRLGGRLAAARRVWGRWT
jgi:hypothetical protein